MGIRAEKKKVIQQVVNNEDSGLPLVPDALLNPTDLHWFQAVTPQQNSEEKDKKEDMSPKKQGE